MIRADQNLSAEIGSRMPLCLCPGAEVLSCYEVFSIYDKAVLLF